MKLRTSVVLTTNELESLLYGYVTGSLDASNMMALPGNAFKSVVRDRHNDVSCQLRFSDDVEGAIVEIYTADD